MTKERVDSLNELGFDWKGSADIAPKALDEEREEKTERMDAEETFV